MTDEITKSADAATPDNSPPVTVTTPDPAPAKPAKASKPAKPSTVTVINDSGFKFSLGYSSDNEASIIAPGENKDVDADIFDNWSKQLSDSELIKSGLIYKK